MDVESGDIDSDGASSLAACQRAAVTGPKAGGGLR